MSENLSNDLRTVKTNITTHKQINFLVDFYYKHLKFSTLRVRFTFTKYGYKLCNLIPSLLNSESEIHILLVTCLYRNTHTVNQE